MHRTSADSTNILSLLNFMSDTSLRRVSSTVPPRRMVSRDAMISALAGFWGVRLSLRMGMSITMAPVSSSGPMLLRQPVMAAVRSRRIRTLAFFIYAAKIAKVTQRGRLTLRHFVFVDYFFANVVLNLVSCERVFIGTERVRTNFERGYGLFGIQGL